MKKKFLSVKVEFIGFNDDFIVMSGENGGQNDDYQTEQQKYLDKDYV
ncbi:MAG: hypothetical protein IJS67_04715 [Clostridia bacterium]|nr:hypothetical protein [Clostridia bacterium]